MSRIEQIRKLLDQNPADSFLKHALALEFIKLGKDDRARTLFEDLLNSNPDYVGSYYHLAKLLERTGDENLAVEIYEKGMDVALKLNEQHAYGELRSAYEDLTF